MSSRKLEKRGIAVIALVLWMLIISFASPVYAANNIAVNSSSNSTVQDTTSTMTELNGANLSVSTDSGELYYMVSLDMRNNRTAWSAKTYGAFVIDGVRQRTMNLTRMAYPFNIVVSGASTVSPGSHTVAFEVNHSGTRKGMIYSNNFSVRFLKTGEYTTLDTVNSSAQITRSQVTGQVTVDNTQNSSIAGLQSNDTTDRSYVNDTFLKLDGTSNMIGDLNMGNNYFTNSSSVNTLNAKGAGYWFDGTNSVIAIIPIIGKTDGPVIQSMGTTTEKKVNVSFDVVMQKGYRTTKPNGLSSVIAYKPTTSNPTGVHQGRKTESWSPSTGAYNLSLEWIYV